MSPEKISVLPAAGALDGTELVPVVQGGVTKHATSASISNASGPFLTAVSVATANGVSGSSSGGATPALTLVLGAITPTSVNGLTLPASHPAADGYLLASTAAGVGSWKDPSTLIITTLKDSTDPTKVDTFDVSHVSTATTRTTTVPDANNVLVVPDTGASNNFLTGITALGAITKAQPAVANLSDATTAGQNLVKITNPGAISFPKFAADNSVSTRTPAQVLSDIGAQASGSYAASGANADITSASAITSLGTGSTSVKFNSSGLFQIGGTTSSFAGFVGPSPGSSTNLGLRKADNSDWSTLEVFSVNVFSSGVTSHPGLSISGGNGIRLASFYPISFSSDNGNSNVLADCGLMRNAAGQISINDGSTTSTNYRDLKARYYYTSVTNDASQAGAIGEYVESLIAIGSPQSLSNGTAANITSISLTAGDWDVSAIASFTETTATVTSRTAGISSTSATLPTDGSEGYCGVQSTVTSETNSITLSRKRISISSTTTVYLVGKAAFSAGTCGGFGQINARRVR